MARQHCAPVLLMTGTAQVALEPLGMHSGTGAVSEAQIQELIHAHPGCLPIAEIDPMFLGAVPICRELNTPAGPIDNLLMTPSGLPVLVECKLWRNPQARREVVGQILDYAKELSRLSASDLQRDVKARLKKPGNPLLERVRAADTAVDEAEFNDALTRNLRRGRFLLIIVGDGIREGVEAIAEYLEAHANLHFSLGLVELPIYVMPDSRRLVVPRVLLRTHVIVRSVIELPANHMLASLASQEAYTEANYGSQAESSALQNEQEEFWEEFLRYLKLDDLEQPLPKAARKGSLWFSLPKGPDTSAWLTVYRPQGSKVGVFLTSSPEGAGRFAVRAVVDAWPDIKDQLGATARISKEGERLQIVDSTSFGSFSEAGARAKALHWLRERTNTFINVLRPRVRLAMADYASRNEQN